MQSPMPCEYSSPVSRIETQPGEEAVWMLLRTGGSDADQREILVDPVPFSVGRQPGCCLQLNYRTISGHHADLQLDRNQLWVVDRKSTNGTYVNGRRISEPTPLREEDLVQFADVAMRVKCDVRRTTCHTLQEDVCDQALALVQFDRLMENRLVTPFYQPIVDIFSGRALGYEVLARSRVFGMESCAAMFNAAARLNMEVELSRMLRWEGVREGLNLPAEAWLFVNTHPFEISRDGLVESMAQVRQLSQEARIILEIHEAAVTDPAEMRTLRAQLRELNIGVAYDDFCAGQTRLGELVEAPPDYLKFDMSMIRRIDQAPSERQRMLGSLVKMVRELGIAPLAEGIETAAEANTCRELGFSTAQGFYFGAPAPLRQYSPLQ
ncbi:MAG: EAL domain-containing protein [Pirellulaceae bacterium]|nr:EAL domain-containing protein [Pirellulaceae bacterium]